MTTRADTGSKLDSPSATTAHSDSTTDSGRTAALGGAVSDAAVTVRDVAAETAARLPDAAATARSAIEDANRQMRGGSDEMLTVGSALSFGLAAGLLIGGAPRVIVVGAFIPAVAMVLTMFNRANPGRGAVGRSMQGR
jgi:hypothetical protein